MFYGKKIKQLEDQLARTIAALGDTKAEVCRLSGVVKNLQELVVVTNFDTDEYVALMQESGAGQEEIDCMLKEKDEYEKKLRKFVRGVVSKRKPNTKSLTDGKENPKAAE